MASKHIPLPGQPVHLSEFMARNLMQTGVYFLFHRGDLVYIGQTRTMKWRLYQHLSEGRKVFDSVGFIPCGLDRLLEIEGHYIRQYAPKYNNCSIAKAVRQERELVPQLKMATQEMDRVCADEIVFNLHDAADFLSIPKHDLANWRKVGVLPVLSLSALIKFAAHARREIGQLRKTSRA